MTQTPVLSVQGLKIEFARPQGALAAVNDVSFDVGAGEILGLVGESGAGKSIIGSAIMGLLDPPGRIGGGAVLLNGERIDDLAEPLFRRIRGKRIGMIFQDPMTSLNPLFTVGEQLIRTMTTHLDISRSAARERALELMCEVGIVSPEKRIDQYPHQFSGGMRQRIVVTLALCAEPEIVIADEPTTALDVSIQAQMIGLIKRMCVERGLAVVLITHDMGVIAEVADRVAVLYAGRLAEIGPVADILQRPLHPYTSGLMAAIPSVDSVSPMLEQIPGTMPRLSEMPGGCAFHPRCSKALTKCDAELPEPRRYGPRYAACHWIEANGGHA